MITLINSFCDDNSAENGGTIYDNSNGFINIHNSTISTSYATNVLFFNNVIYFLGWWSNIFK